MLSRNGKANAATAAVPANPALSAVLRSFVRDTNSPTKAKVPAKPSPHCVGIALANNTPIRDATFQASQFTENKPAK